MINDKDRQEGYRRNMHAEHEELQQATQRFIRSLFRTGVSAALMPVTMLPREPQHHFRAAGREFTHGLATLVREFADGIEEIAKDASTPTHHEEDAHTTGEAEASQDS
ncbi:MAG: hypothetical protein ACJ788_20840 [Ktedonobacteraceae bacterium]